MLRRWRTLADGYDPHRILIGETYVLDPDRARCVLRQRRRAEPRVQLHAPALEVRRRPRCAPRSRKPSSTCPRTRGRCGRAATTTTIASPSRWCDDDPAKIRAALVMLMGLRGTPFLYYGDEIGMPDTEIPDRPRARSRSACSTARASAAIRSARRCPGPASPARATPRPASSRGSRSATSPRATWPTSATIPTRCSR